MPDRKVAVCDVVIIGSYPPLPGPATAATLAAVRRAWEAGADVRVVSYRTGAAEIAVPVTGPIAGRRLDQVRQHFANPAEVVLGLQRGVPFSDPRPSQQLATAVGLAAALRRFRRATLLVGEDPEVMPACFRILASAVERFIVATPEEASWLVKQYRLKPAAVAVEEVERYPRLPDGVDPATAGLYRPGSGAGLTVVQLPTTTLADRAAPGRGGRGGALHLGPKNRQTGQAPHRWPRLAGPRSTRKAEGHRKARERRKTKEHWKTKEHRKIGLLPRLLSGWAPRAGSWGLRC